MPQSSFWSLCVHRKWIFFSLNRDEIFILITGLYNSFPICLLKVRSQLKEKHNRRTCMCVSEQGTYLFFGYFFSIFGSTSTQSVKNRQ